MRMFKIDYSRDRSDGKIYITNTNKINFDN